MKEDQKNKFFLPPGKLCAAVVPGLGDDTSISFCISLCKSPRNLAIFVDGIMLIFMILFSKLKIISHSYAIKSPYFQPAAVDF